MEMPVAAFRNIEVHDNINVVFTQDTVYKIMVEAGKNLLPLISAENEGKWLVIRNNNKCNWVRSFKKNVINVSVWGANIDSILHFGSGDISSANTIKSQILTLEAKSSGNINVAVDAATSYCNISSGVGDITMRGFSGVSYVYLAGSGYVHCKELVTGYTFLENRGTGDCYVNVTKEIGSTISYTGNVYYSGNPPVVNSVIRGTGKLIKE